MPEDYRGSIAWGQDLFLIRYGTRLASKPAQVDIMTLSTSNHLLVTVHGIRTFGAWQERLEHLLKKEDPNVEVAHYKYGYLSAITFAIPVLRRIVIARFRKSLSRMLAQKRWSRVDFVGHSFGTHLIGNALKSLPDNPAPPIHTVILSSSPLPFRFPWNDIIQKTGCRVINDCASRDFVLFFAQLVIGAGMSGRYGFVGMHGESFRNRFFGFGHSGYFVRDNKPDGQFMKKYWVPLLLRNEPVKPGPTPCSSIFEHDIFLPILLNLEPIKIVVYVALFITVAYFLGNAFDRDTALVFDLPYQASYHDSDNPIVDAAVSPSGESTAYVDQSGIYIRSYQSGVPRRVSIPDSLIAQEVNWFPDENRIVATLVKAETCEMSIWSLSLTGGEHLLLAEKGSGGAVSPDGSSLAFLKEENEIWLVNADGTEQTLIARFGQDQYCNTPSWSPDGHRVAYVRYWYDNEQHAALETIRSDGTDSTRVLLNRRLLLSLGMPPRSAWWTHHGIMYVLREGPPNESDANLWELQVDQQTGRPTSSPRQISFWAGHQPVNPSANGDGDLIGFIRFENQIDVIVAQLDLENYRLSDHRRITQTDSNDWPSGWSLDGKKIYFWSDRHGRYDIFRQPVDANEPDSIFVLDQSEETWAQTLHGIDGEELYHWSYASDIEGLSGSVDLVRRTLTPGNVDTVFTKTSPTRWWIGQHPPTRDLVRFRCDGSSRALIISELQNTVLLFRKYSLSDGELSAIGRVTLRQPEDYDWDVSPDGEKIALVQSDGTLDILNISDLKLDRSVAIPGYARIQHVSWCADSRHVLVSELLECGYRLSVFDESGSHYDLWRSRKHYFSTVRASASGNEVALGVMTWRVNAWAANRNLNNGN